MRCVTGPVRKPRLALTCSLVAARYGIKVSDLKVEIERPADRLSPVAMFICKPAVDRTVSREFNDIGQRSARRHVEARYQTLASSIARRIGGISLNCLALSKSCA